MNDSVWKPLPLVRPPRAAEVPRRNGVYPGVMRDLRRQHRLRWTGWDR